MIKYIKSFVFIFVILSLFSCISSREIKYLQIKNANDTVSANSLQYKIQPRDHLYIKLISIDPQVNAYINPADNGTSVTNAGYAARYKDIYVVNDSGYVEIPQAGKLFVNQLTADEIKLKIEQTVDFNQTTVIVRLADYSITVLGAVVRPGKFVIDDDKLSVFEALGMAGDLSDFANRKNVKIVRETEKGQQVFEVDLTDRNLIHSDCYFLKPNDVVYVEPHRATFLASNRFPYTSTLAIILSTATSILVIMNYFK